jgi:hypothetical protein
MTIWEPQLEASIATDQAQKDLDKNQNKMKYKARLDEYMKREIMYNGNLYKAYALIWDRCAKSMQNKIQTRSDYESRMYNKPIQLLKAIKEHALNDQETKYEMSIMADAFRGILGTTQHKNESLQDYTTRFKTAKEVLQLHVGGTLTLTKFVTTMAGYVSNDVQIIEQLSKVAE